MTGRELVAYLIKANHLGEVKSFYLNYEDSKNYKPYNLVTVPKVHVIIALIQHKMSLTHELTHFFNLKAEPEHFIFSVFGVLHMVPGEENENLSLAEWNRHAVLYEACKKMKFFSQFLFRKFFLRFVLYKVE